MGQKGFARESEKEEYDLVAIESVTAAIESAVGLEESFHWLFLRMDVDISRLLARALAEQLPLLPSISFPFLALDLVTAPWEHL